MEERLLYLRCADDRPLGLAGAGVESGSNTFGRMVDVGRKLRDGDVTDIVVVGCSGMARHRPLLEVKLGVSVIDSIQAAASIAIGIVAVAGG